MGFAVKFALGNGISLGILHLIHQIYTALCKGIPQGKHRLDREGAV